MTSGVYSLRKRLTEAKVDGYSDGRIFWICGDLEYSCQIMGEQETIYPRKFCLKKRSD